jgi:hypothetical protein
MKKQDENIPEVSPDIVRQFWEAHDETRFDSTVIAAVRGCSVAKLDYEGWRGTGIPYFKDSAHRRYRKKDVVKYLDAQRIETVSSTAVEVAGT